MTAPDGLTYNQNLIIAITTLVLALSYISYGLRLYARRVSGAKVWWDDYMIGGGLVRDTHRSVGDNDESQEAHDAQLFATIPCVSNYVGMCTSFSATDIRRRWHTHSIRSAIRLRVARGHLAKRRPGKVSGCGSPQSNVAGIPNLIPPSVCSLSCSRGWSPPP